MPVEHLPEYVIGFPMHVAITVRAHPDVSFNTLPFADFVSLNSCIGAEITGQHGGEPVRYQPKPHLDPQSGKRGSKLAPGESRRMLADVSPYFNGISEGEYQVRFSYIETDGIYHAPAVTLRLRRPTTAESALLESAAADRPNFPTWGMWTITCPKTPYDGPVSADNPLRFNLLLRQIFCGPQSLDRFDPALLDVLTGLYAPEGRVLEAELYQARGDSDRYQKMRSRILLDAPGLGWWTRMIDGGGAYLKSIRIRP
jgi:hypothetical protein